MELRNLPKDLLLEIIAEQNSTSYLTVNECKNLIQKISRERFKSEDFYSRYKFVSISFGKYRFNHYFEDPRIGKVNILTLLIGDKKYVINEDREDDFEVRL